MSVEIGKNNYQFWMKIIFTPCFLIGSCAMFSSIGSQETFYQATGVAFFAITTLLAALLLTLPLLLLPIKLIIDDNNGIIEIHYLLGKSCYYSFTEILRYTTTHNYTRSETYEGVLIYTADGSKRLLSSFSLHDIDPLLASLRSHNVRDDGAEKFRYFSYYRQAILG